MRKRSFYIFIGIIIVTLLAIVTDVSGLSKAFTLNLGRPITAVTGLDLQGGAQILLRVNLPHGQKPTSDQLNAASQVINARVNGGFGVREPIIRTVNNGNKYYISVELPGLKDKDVLGVESSLQHTGVLTIVGNAATPLNNGASTAKFPVIVHGTDINLSSVATGYDPTSGRPQVTFTVNSGAASSLSTYTTSHVGQYMAIALDGKVYQDTTVQQPIPNGDIAISTQTLQDAQNIATELKYGALPVPLSIESVRQVSAELGPANIRASLIAGLVGLLIVVVFMALYYRLPGLLADGALIIYALVVFAVFKLIPVTLTLAGIAGFILSIGMAVDANILIFERMKEELRAGLSVAAAVDAGFARAWPSIRDSNASTMITCAILYWFGSTFGASIIVGFASTLFIGVAISMITAILVSRTFLRLVLGAGARTASPALFGAEA